MTEAEKHALSHRDEPSRPGRGAQGLIATSATYPRWSLPGTATSSTRTGTMPGPTSAWSRRTKGGILQSIGHDVEKPRCSHSCTSRSPPRQQAAEGRVPSAGVEVAHDQGRWTAGRGQVADGFEAGLPGGAPLPAQHGWEGVDDQEADSSALDVQLRLDPQPAADHAHVAGDDGEARVEADPGRVTRWPDHPVRIAHVGTGRSEASAHLRRELDDGHHVGARPHQHAGPIGPDVPAIHVGEGHPHPWRAGVDRRAPAREGDREGEDEQRDGHRGGDGGRARGVGARRPAPRRGRPGGATRGSSSRVP